jgi:dienelactone hydrolase
MGIRYVYTWVGYSLASLGYVVAVVQVPNLFGTDDQQWADAIKDGISYLQAQNSSSSVLEGMISGVFGAAGHSMGGGGVLLAASQDSRISAVVSMAPPSPSMGIGGSLFQKVYDGAKLIRVPVQILAGSADILVPATASQAYYPVLGAPKEFVEISGAGHTDYIDMPLNATALNTVEKYTKNWFNYYLKGDTSCYTYIFGAEAQNDFASGALSALDFAP